ncbi:fructosamine kinase family protein [Marinirhabdus gelatinilytica]|uniref:Fructosamine-3-kinase n=1 Tax=Marinirhabdus gelatinilytica TaxID=1703343 RepID=A0A370Q664_9FLAO|nr:fructosamine kinase family protein [Marinirhabdus gelatinilytica]RDK83856.1 hypothetical protein C8D94_10669 [Marinirhabdus gelatinilytica]
MKSLLKEIALRHDCNLNEVKPLSGGDINQVFLLKCKETNLVAKLNLASKFPTLFEAEAKGLQRLAASKSFKIPKVLGTGEISGYAYLLLEHIPQDKPVSGFWERFAENLAALHKTSHNRFGLDHDNYIGSLKQFNCPETTAADFYLNQRLIPQFRLAMDNGFQFEDLGKFYKKVLRLIPDGAPSLVHGDLWNGNYLISEKGAPVLIDPAVAYAPCEMDLAMMQLFGGFPQEVFSTYDEIFNLQEDWKERVPLFQLYYLLVHLNLFGHGYLQQVKGILKKFS